MRKEEKRILWTAVILLIIIAAMSVGFAAYATTLKIGGNSNNLTVKKQTWSVHWNTTYNTNGYKLNTDSQSIGTPSVQNNTVTFTTTLNKIGEFADFTVQAINDGTIDAKLTGITISGLTTEQKKYVTAKVNYGGTDYTDSQSGLNVSLPSTSGSNTKDVTLRVEYKEPKSADDLPQADQQITLTVTFDYASV